MGLASSQARLLNLTSRMHQIEYNAQRIEAMKLQMANESRQVYLEYSEALEQTKVQFKTLNSNGSATYVDVTSIDQMINAGFTLVVHDVPKGEWKDELEVNEDYIKVGDKYYAKTDVNEDGSLNDNATEVDEETATSPTGNKFFVASGGVEDVVIDNIEAKEATDETPAIDAKSATAVLEETLNAKFGASAQGKIVVGSGQEFEKLLTNLINMGSVTILEQKLTEDGKKVFPKAGSIEFADYQSSVATNTSFQEVTDETGLRKAEAKYEADMRRIDMKDRKYDYDLAALENERNAIKQEMETLKTVSKDNVDRTFKLFS